VSSVAGTLGMWAAGKSWKVRAAIWAFYDALMVFAIVGGVVAGQDIVLWFLPVVAVTTGILVRLIQKKPPGRERSTGRTDAGRGLK
jgi:hypothetical protein